MSHPLRFAVVVPALVRTDEDADHLRRCLAALQACAPPPTSIVVVDDGSPHPVEASGVKVLRQANAGPAAARNRGFAEVDPSVTHVVFVDADIVVPADTFARLAQGFADTPDAAAIWGTVTSSHPHPGLVSRYKNHTHRHFTLQQGARTRHLTSMLVAIRRDAFLRVGGFDTRWTTVSVEDVELGRALFEAGEPVVLDTALAAEHHHRFTALSALRNDFRKVRAHAATTLARRARGGTSVDVDGPGERRQVHYLVGIPLGMGAVGALLLGRWRTALLLTGALAWWERDLLRHLAREEGVAFALSCVPWMLVERNVAGLAIGTAVLGHIGGMTSNSALATKARP